MVIDRLCELSTKGGTSDRQSDMEGVLLWVGGWGSQGFAQHSMRRRALLLLLVTATLDRQRQRGDAAAKRAARAVFVCQVSRGWIGGLVDLWIVLGASSSLVVGVRSCQCCAVSSCVVPACPPRSLPAACLPACLPAFKSCPLSLPPSPPSSTSSARGAV
jgi:hypothetical protein